MTDMTAIARGDTRIEWEARAAAGLDHDDRSPESQLDIAVEAADFAASALRAHRGNGLMARLDKCGNLGARLTPEQVTAVVGIVAMLEGAPQPAQLMP